MREGIILLICMMIACSGGWLMWSSREEPAAERMYSYHAEDWTHMSLGSLSEDGANRIFAMGKKISSSKANFLEVTGAAFFGNFNYFLNTLDIYMARPICTGKDRFHTSSDNRLAALMMEALGEVRRILFSTPDAHEVYDIMMAASVEDIVQGRFVDRETAAKALGRAYIFNLLNGEDNPALFKAFLESYNANIKQKGAAYGELAEHGSRVHITEACARRVGVRPLVDVKIAHPEGEFEAASVDLECLFAAELFLTTRLIPAEFLDTLGDWHYDRRVPVPQED